MNARTWVRDRVFSIIKRMLAPSEIRRYLAGTNSARLNIGCGGNRIPNWLNADRYPPPGTTFVDAAKRLSFNDSVFDAILCEHMIEHIPKSAAIDLLTEMRRTLRPGGVVRIVTPDLEWLSRHILQPPPADAVDEAYRAFLRSWHRRDDVSWCDALNLCFYEHGHCYIWSPAELRAQMEATGFVGIVLTRGGHPHSTLFADAEGHAKIMGAIPNTLEAFGLEARAPL